MVLGRIYDWPRGSGESWQFRELQSETRLCLNERLIYLDRFRLCPAERGQSRWAMGLDTYTGTGLYVGKEARCVASALHQSMPKAGVDAPAENVAIARVVSNSGPEFQQALASFCSHAESV